MPEPFSFSSYSPSMLLQSPAPVAGSALIGKVVRDLMRLPPHAALSFAMILQELATNAVKYGALSAATGMVKLLRDESPSGRVVMHWCESGGPQVKRGGRVGFGTRVLESALRPQGGNVDFSFESHGFEARVEFPQA